MKKLIKTESDRFELMTFVQNMELGLFCDISKPKVKRSLDQNALHWLYMSILETESNTGYTKEEFHKYFIEKFAPVKEMFDCFVLVGTSEMDSKQMTEFIEKYRHFCEMEEAIRVFLPYPNDKRILEYYEKFNYKIK